MSVRYGLFIVTLTLCCGLAFVASLWLGSASLPASSVWAALSAYDPGDPQQAMVRGLRLPRALAGVLCGAALAVAGVIMQKLTRNPLADPGLMGINAGAALAVVAMIALFGPQGPLWLAAGAMAGAGLAALAVWSLAGGTGIDADRGAILRLPLAGMAISALCLSLVTGSVLLSTETRELYRFWMVGALAQAQMPGILPLLPVFAAGLVLSLLCARGLEVLELGGEVASGLGLRPNLIIAIALVGVTVLSGAAVAIAGPLGFVGLIVPHAARAVAGHEMRMAILAGMPLGAGMVLICDLLGRMMVPPTEIALGIVLALIGGPGFLVLLSRVLRTGAP